jgi:dolichyl-phosphate-mannose--protein O-mannosyl transferase
MFKTIIVVWLALLVLALYVFTSVTRIIEKRRPTLPSHGAQKKFSAS